MKKPIKELAKNLHDLFLQSGKDLKIKETEVALEHSKDYNIADWQDSFEKQLVQEQPVSVEEFIFKKECILFHTKIKEYKRNIKLGDIHEVFSKSKGYKNWDTYLADLKDKRS